MTEEKTESPAQEEGTEDFAAMLAAHSASSGRLQPGRRLMWSSLAEFRFGCTRWADSSSVLPPVGNRAL